MELSIVGELVMGYTGLATEGVEGVEGGVTSIRNLGEHSRSKLGGTFPLGLKGGRRNAPGYIRSAFTV